MNEKKPQIDSGGFSGVGEIAGLAMPTVAPPSSNFGEELLQGGSMGEAAGIASAISGGDSAPALLPADAAAAGVTAWQNGKKITGLWSINQNRNSWLHVAGIGWRKLSNNSDSGIVALTMLGAHAREKATNVNYREESDGMIHEMYVW
jgi:hypothetical protein